jgi:hypothetical protein
MTNTPEKFWTGVEVLTGEDACWEWAGYRIKQGYGRLRYHSRKQLAVQARGNILSDLHGHEDRTLSW